MSFGDFFWLVVISYLFICYLMVLLPIFRDLFRDRELSGWWKGLWVIALITIPFVSAFMYLIARGRAMAERQVGEMQWHQAATDSYIQQIAGRSNLAEQIAVKGQMNDGAITQTELDRLDMRESIGIRSRVSYTGQISPRFLRLLTKYGASPSLTRKVAGLVDEQSLPEWRPHVVGESERKTFRRSREFLR